MKDNLIVGQEVKEKMMSGIEKVANAVGATMGTGGSNSMIEAIESPGHLMTNDGYSIANAIRLSDPLEDMGKKVLLESINRANKASGDGSSTTCVTTAAIIREGMKSNNIHTPMEIKKSLEDCLPLIEAEIERLKTVVDVTAIANVATISSEDEEIGKTIQEIYEKIGKDGIIHWDISKSVSDSYTIGSGITIEGAGFCSPYMADTDEKTGLALPFARLKDVKILITKQKIISAIDFETLFSSLNNQDIKEVVVFCDEYDATVVNQLVMTKFQRGFRGILVKMPTIFKDEWFIDLAEATGATIIDPQAGLYLKNAKIEHLGTASHINITKSDTSIDGIKDVSSHVEKLLETGNESDVLRASRLNTKTARYYVGAHSDSALSYRRLKVEDAISASYHALTGGVVAGGGVFLRDVSEKMPDTVGGRILREALKAPFKQILKNIGASKMIDHVLFLEGEGVDTRTQEVVNMLERNIIDPANIVLNVCKNSISVAASVLTAHSVVLLPREEVSQRNSPNVLI